MNTKLFLTGTIISVAVLTGCTPAPNTTTTNTTANTVSPTNSNTAVVNTNSTNSPAIEADDTPLQNVNNSNTPTTTTSTDVVTPTRPGSYIDYNAEAVAQAATTGDAVLFFHAPWCPTCTALNKDIVANASTIPAGVTIFRTDYDTNLELRRKYGVTYQHTLVQVDADGNMITKWSGGYTLNDVLSKIQ